MRLRRRRHCFIAISDQPNLDVAAFLRGEVKWSTAPTIELMCPLLAESIPLEADDLRALALCPADQWVDIDSLALGTGVSVQSWRSLVDRRVVFADSGRDDDLLEREERAARMGWEPRALLYHRFSSWRGVSGTEATRDHSAEAERARLESHVARYGRPPEAFVRQPQSQHTQFLAAPGRGALQALLRRRLTTRAFDQSRALDQDSLSGVLFAAFGVHGTRQLPSSMTALKKGSPSGGGLHPIEAYVLIAKVSGMAAGLYHYRSDIHALDLLLALPEAGVRERMCAAAAGQAYFAEAHAAVLHVARFGRHFWKYVEHHKAYKAILMDSAHVSQTIYLAATELDLGAYYTAAVNDADVDAWLGLDGVAASCVAMSGFGIPDKGRSELHFIADPYDPLEARRSAG